MIRFNLVGLRGLGCSRSLPRLGAGLESSGLALGSVVVVVEDLFTFD